MWWLYVIGVWIVIGLNCAVYSKWDITILHLLPGLFFAGFFYMIIFGL